MCGICGWLGLGAGDDRDRVRLEHMAESLRHRGPEERGTYLEPGAALAVQRLKIVDPEGGRQPIANETGTVRVVVNGEIYNARELRSELEGRGHRFSTRSDAEPIVHLYEELGPRLVHRLRGMFALAVWDGLRRRLLLARDRFGIKPLVFSTTENGLLFGSEAKAILSTGVVGSELDPEGLRQLFAFGFVLNPRTLVRGVRQLPPGHLMTVDEGEAPAVERYWEPTFPPCDGYERRSADEWAEMLRAKLEESVRLHLRSDVPVGAWMSSGLDSSSVVEFMRSLGTPPADVVSLAFDAPECDEVGTTPTLVEEGRDLPARRVQCGQQDVGLLPLAAWHSEAPTPAGLEVPRLLLARASSERVKVVLTGEGADELLGGYRWYHGDRLMRPLARLPRSLRWFLQAGPVCGAVRPRSSALFLAPHTMDLVRFRAMVGPLIWHEAAKVVPDLGPEPPEWQMDPAPPDEFSTWHPFCQLQYVDMRVRLPDFVIHTLDRSSMACAVEARVPFLDHELAELCARIPPAVKMRGFVEKDVLRRAVRGLLPEPIRKRRKRGMDTPVDAWFRGELPAAVARYLDPGSAPGDGLVDVWAAARCLERHRRGRVTAGRVLSGVVGLQTVVERLLSDGACDGS